MQKLKKFVQEFEEQTFSNDDVILYDTSVKLKYELKSILMCNNTVIPLGIKSVCFLSLASSTTFPLYNTLKFGNKSLHDDGYFKQSSKESK